eukprot:CAMPEP_0194275670 /NCGR_PEP_ID=MMETSP0169-20130528/8457_1 /TAXON_ID=218684 /ORGANISM="Corethron pennatum, Strain L29A3" /LENGTH=597 /DNA_ID=CAMNT_0039019197 /DNA_START=55 /DNA_END=1848 /DNA_ORIENTATION=-
MLGRIFIATAKLVLILVVPSQVLASENFEESTEDANSPGKIFGLVRKIKDPTEASVVSPDSILVDSFAAPSGPDPPLASEPLRAAVSSYFSSPASPSATTVLEAAVRSHVHSPSTNMRGYVSGLRRTLHLTPELLYDERTTSAVIQSVLDTLPNLTYTSGWAVNTHVSPQMPGAGGTGIVAEIGTGRPPCVLLRADIDGLPIFEQLHSDYESVTAGRMHACGHDGHSSMLLGAASVLSAVASSINGTVRIIFQPAEEGGAGAKRMVEEGVLSKLPAVQAAYGMHLWPGLPSGTVGGRPGVGFAAADMFGITIAGIGGHAAMPHLTTDPVVAASAAVTALQSLVARNVSPLESGVVSVTFLKTGEEVYNVIPGEVKMGGTVRSLTEDGLAQLRKGVERVVRGAAEAYGCTATVRWSFDFYPPVSNDAGLWKSMVEGVAGRVARIGPNNEAEPAPGATTVDPPHDNGAVSNWAEAEGGGGVTLVQPTMGGEDFSFIAGVVPSAFLLLGQGTGEALVDADDAGDSPVGGTNPGGLRGKVAMHTNLGLHHPKFAMDESVLPLGVELHINLALQTLKALLNEGSGTETNNEGLPSDQVSQEF